MPTPCLQVNQMACFVYREDTDGKMHLKEIGGEKMNYFQIAVLDYG
jgi:hypothetical protein